MIAKIDGAVPNFDRAITISGDPGSGKSTVGRSLAQDLGMRFFSTGEIHREIAEREQKTTLELNLAAETDSGIDQEVDQVLKDLAASGEPVVVDSRMAWWFMRDAISVHLTVYPAVGATRAFGRHNQVTEQYSDVNQALDQTRSRAESERQRFKRLYGVKIEHLANYDLVLDTTSATPRVLTDCILAELQEIGTSRPNIREVDGGQRPTLHVDPSYVYPTEMITVLRSLDQKAVEFLGSIEFLHQNPIQVCYEYPFYFAVDGHKRLSSAILRGLPLIPAELVAEGEELVYGNVSVKDMFTMILQNPTPLYDWSAVHRTELDIPTTPY
jgi:predicted cytidylate kinase